MEKEKLQLNDLIKAYKTRTISRGSPKCHKALFSIYDKDVSRFLKDVTNSDCHIARSETIFKDSTFYFRIYQIFQDIE